MRRLRHNSFRSVCVFALFVYVAAAARCSHARAQTAGEQAQHNETVLRVPRAEVPQGPLGRRYTQTFPAFGGVQPYVFTVTGTIPVGMHWTTADNGMALDGVPQFAGDFPISVTVTDAAGERSTQNYVLEITPNDSGSSINVPVTEAVSVTDVPSVGFIVPINVAESISVTDVPSVALPVVVNVSEAISVTDTVGTTESIFLAISEPVSVTDTPLVSPPLQVNVSEAISVTETVGTTESVFLAISEPIAVTDAPLVSPPLQVNVSEAISVADTVGTAESVFLAISEPIAVTDAPLVSPPLQVNISEAISVTDMVGTAESVFLAISEPIAVTDAPLVSPPLQVNISEAISVTDMVGTAESVFLAISEPIAVTDAPLVSPPLQVNVSEGISVTDMVGTAESVFITISEPIAVTDAPLVSLPLQVNVSEGISVTDTVGTAESVFIGVSETITTTDTPSVLSEAPTITVTASPSASVVYATPASVLVSIGGASGPATGTITFTINGGASQGPILLSSGSAVIGLGTLDVGTYSVAVIYSGDSNYTAGDPTTASVTLNPAVLSMVAPNTSMVAGAPVPALTPSYTGFVNGDSAAALSSGASCSTTATSGSATGTYPITCSGAAALNYTFAYNSGTLTVTKGTAEKITFAALPDVTYGVAPITLNGTATSGLLVTYAVLQGNAALTPVGSGFALAITGSGAVTVEARQSGNTTYAPAQPVDRTFNVAPRALSVTADNQKRAAGQADPPLTYSFQGFVNGDTAAVITGTPVLSTTALVNSPAGTYNINITAGTLVSTSYEFELEPGLLTVTSAKTGTAQKITFANIANKTYGATAVTLAATATSGLPVSYTVISGPATLANNALSITGAGTVVVEADQTGNTTWEAADPVQRTFVVSPKILKVTADSVHRAYAQPNPVFSYAMTGFVNGETAAVISGAPSLSTAATSSSDVGTYTIAITTGTLASANYTFDLEPGTLTITIMSQTLNYPALGTVNYGSAPIVLGATASSGLGVTYQIIGTPAGATLSGSTINITGQGSITIEADQAGNIDYQPVSAKRTLTIKAAPLVVSADNQNKQQGNPNPTLTWSVNGFVNGDQLSILTGTPVLSTTAKTQSPVGSYPIKITAGTLVAPPNYVLQMVNGTLTVNSNIFF